MAPHNPRLNRREFLRQTFAFSALAAIAPGAILHAQGTATAPPPDPAAPHMLTIGDWGTDKYLDQQIAVANAMKKWVDIHQVHPGALFLLGDNWYGNMGIGYESARWQKQFEQMYPVSYFPGPAYAVLGNHDYEHKISNKVDLQLGYAAFAKGTRWTMPARWFTFNYPEKNPVTKFICLDSNLPGTKSDPFPWSTTMSHKHKDEQNEWFKAELAKPRTTPFVTVVAHHPLYTNGVHKDNKLLIGEWEDMVKQAKVDFWLTGHDHDLQHIEFANHPTSFVISGGGGAELVEWSTAPEKRGPYGGKVLGFTDIEFKPDGIIMRHIDQNAKTLHAFRKLPDGKVELFLPG
jgi:tartrate-resistant acid phosphatase type 5